MKWKRHFVILKVCACESADLFVARSLIPPPGVNNMWETASKLPMVLFLIGGIYSSPLLGIEGAV